MRASWAITAWAVKRKMRAINFIVNLSKFSPISLMRNMNNMIKKLGFLGLFLSIPALALVPVEGILMGEAHEAIQSDPLRRIFSHTKEEKGLTPEQRKIKYYNASYTAGMALGESCSYLGAPEYSTPWQNKQIRRNVVATLQYIGLDTTIKAIGAY